MTFTQIQSRFIKILRSVRRTYRASSTAGEKLERELDRLIKRQHGQLIQPDDLKMAIKLFQTYEQAVGRVPKAFNDALTVMNMPVVA